MVSSWITNDNKSWFLEFLGILICKSTWSPFSTKVVCTSVCCKFQDGSLSISSIGNNQYVFWIVNSSNNSCSNHKFFPRLGKIKVINSLFVSGVNVVLHLS